MRVMLKRMLFSATDLMRFMGCAHATLLDLAHLRGRGPQPRADSEDAALLQRQGDAHEQRHLTRMQTIGGVMEITRGDLAANAETTRNALATGHDVVFQGAFLSGNWGGWSDFLERVERPSALGAFSYEVTDTKLKRRPHPKHVLQLVWWSAFWLSALPQARRTDRRRRLRPRSRYCRASAVYPPPGCHAWRRG